MASGGKPKGVYVVTDAQLKSAVGGTYDVQAGPALRVAGFDSAGERGVTGGPLTPVYVVSAAEAARRGVMGGKAIPIADLTSSGRANTDPQIAIPVYVETGSEYIGGGVTPTPPTPPASLTYYNMFMWQEVSNAQSDTIPDWTVVTGATTGVRLVNGGEMYPQNLVADMLWIFSDPPVPITSNDQWAEVEIAANGTFAGTHSVYIGPAVRCSSGQNDCYAFVIWQDGWDLLKFSAGSKSELDADASTAPNVGDKYRIEASGSTITAYINDIQVAQVTDGSPLPDGTCGILADGIDANYVVTGYKCGNLPVGNAFKMNNRFGNFLDARNASSWCVPVPVDSLADGQLITVGSHLVNEQHYFELDMQIPCTAYGISSFNYLAADARYTWTEFDVFGKLEAGDAWTLIEADMTLSDPGGSSYWKNASFAGGEQGPYRYWRVVIDATADASNNLRINEVCLIGRTVT